MAAPAAQVAVVMTVQQRRQLETAVLRALADDDGNEILASTMGVFRAVNPDGPGLVWSYGRVRDCLRSLAIRGAVRMVRVPLDRNLYWETTTRQEGEADGLLQQQQLRG